MGLFSATSTEDPGTGRIGMTSEFDRVHATFAGPDVPLTAIAAELEGLQFTTHLSRLPPEATSLVDTFTIRGPGGVSTSMEFAGGDVLAPLNGDGYPVFGPFSFPTQITFRRFRDRRTATDVASGPAQVEEIEF